VTELTGAAATAAKKATDLGWTVQHSTVVVHVPDVLMESDGATGQRGEIRTPAHDEVWVTVAATHPQGVFGFKASWRDRKFVDAHIIDPLGIPVENWVDYASSSHHLRRVKDEPAKAHQQRVAEAQETALRRAWEYNDGTFRDEQRHYTKKATVLTTWLNDLLLVMNPSKAPKPKKIAKQAQPEYPVLLLDEWSA